MVKKGRGRHFSPKLRGSEIWFKHVPDTVPTSNVDQFLSLMAEIVPLDVNSNFGFMVECSRITLDGRKWAGKRFCPETLGWAKWGSWPLNFRPNPGEPNLWISKRYFLGWFSIQFCLELEGLLRISNSWRFLIVHDLKEATSGMVLLFVNFHIYGVNSCQIPCALKDHWPDQIRRQQGNLQAEVFVWD